MLYLTCTMISSVDLACYGVSRAKVWVSVDCGTMHSLSLKTSSINELIILKLFIYRSVFWRQANFL